MAKNAIPRGVRLLSCGCYIIREHGKLMSVITCKEHKVHTLVVARKPRKRRRALD